jgi:hypothetical protein
VEVGWGHETFLFPLKHHLHVVLLSLLNLSLAVSPRRIIVVFRERCLQLFCNQKVVKCFLRRPVIHDRDWVASVLGDVLPLLGFGLSSLIFVVLPLSFG